MTAIVGNGHSGHSIEAAGNVLIWVVGNRLRRSCLGYARVSTEEQANGGVSLAAQRTRVAEYCRLRDFELVDMEIDSGVSGATPLGARPAGARLLERLRAGEAVTVVAVKLDRLFRDAADCLTTTQLWDSEDVALHLVDFDGIAVDTTSAMGRFLLTVTAGFAEMERNFISERTRLALRHLAEEEEVHIGGVPFGFRRSRDKRKLIEHPAEMEVVKRLRSMRRRGRTLASIAAELTLGDVASKNGGRWTATQVRRILMRGARQAPQSQ